MKLNQLILWKVILLTLFINSIESHAIFLAPSDSFRLSGSVVCNEVDIPGAAVSLYLGNTKIRNTSTNSNGVYVFYLAHNKNYTIEASKKGYVTVKIEVDTKVSKDVIAKGGIEEALQVDIRTYEYYPQLKMDVFNNSLEVYRFDEKAWYFNSDLKKSKIAVADKLLVTVRNKNYTEAIRKANEYFTKQDFSNALTEYTTALNNKPKDDIALQKVKECRKELKKQGGLEKLYKEAISNADNDFKKANYEDALVTYKKASSYKPEETYPKKQALITDSLISLKSKKEYDVAIVKADNEFNNKDFENARKDYEAALKAIPGDKYAVGKISVIDTDKKKKEAEAKAIEDKYQNLMKKADGFISKKDYVNASKKIDSALIVKPGDTDALAKKQKVDKLQQEILTKKLEAKKNKDFTDTLALAEKAFSEKKYNIAASLFQACLIIKPDEKAPAQRLEEIKVITKPVVKTITQKPAQADTFKSEKQEITKKEDSFSRQSKITESDITKLLTNADNEIKKGNSEEASKMLLKLGSTLHDQDNLVKSHEILTKAIEAAKKSGNKNEEVVILNEIAAVNYDLGNYKQSVSNYKDIIQIKQLLGDKKGEAEILSDMGSVLENTYQYNEAAEAYTKSLEIHKQLNNKEAVTTDCNKLGTVLYNQSDFEKSQKYFKQALASAEETQNLAVKSGLLNSIGVVSYKMGKFQDAINYYSKAIEAGQEYTNKQNISLAYNNIGNVNYDWNKYDKALEYYQKSLQIKKELNFEEGIAVSLFNIGSTYLAMKNTQKAVEFINSSLTIAKKLNLRDVLQQSYKTLSKLYEANNDFKNAMQNYKEFSLVGASGGTFTEGQITEMTGSFAKESKLVKSLRLELKRQKILTDMEALQKMQVQSKLLVKNLELENEKASLLRHRILLMFTLIFMGFAGIMSLQYYRRYKEKKLYSEIIGFQKQQITDSIEYASKIQKAVMTPGEVVKSIFPDSFILNLPKDIVSGDYFYLTTNNDKIYVAVADCTGHGVPGAFMSMLGISLIKEIIANGVSLSACDILNNLRDAIIKSLHQSDQSNEPKDGMDIALCVVDLNEMTLEYSGANNPCYIVRYKELVELKADRMPVGIHPVIKPFISHKMKLVKNDVIYMFSDGYRDQIGESTLKKFKVASFNNLLLEVHEMPLPDQAASLYEHHLSWKGEMEQTDDILVVGIRI